MQPPFHRLDEFAPASPADQQAALRWQASAKCVARGYRIRQEGDPVEGVYFLLDGWVSSYLSMKDGKRQIAKVHLPGDLLGWPSLALERAGETLECLTGATFSFIPNVEIGQLLRSGSDRVSGLLLSAQRERVALMQELTWIGTASAYSRLAAMFLDLHDRLSAAGQVTGGRFDMPLTQQHLGDLLGLTPVHINRSVRLLDKDGLIMRGKGWVEIPDVARLRDIAPSAPPAYGGRQAWLRLFQNDAESRHHTALRAH